jgi:hypothetical protein
LTGFTGSFAEKDERRMPFQPAPYPVHLRVVRGRCSARIVAILFEGERFDVMSVRRWREKVLGA